VKVVLAHRSRATRRRFARVLGEVGHDVVEVSTAGETLERCREDPPDVTLVDVELCEGGDAELLCALKGDADAYRTAVVLLERPGLDLGAAVAALDRGVEDFLVEPIADGELVARVHAAGRTTVLQQELVDQARRMEALVCEDPLTGLVNRRSILTQLAGMVSGARRHGRPLSVAIVDIDHFKAVNDTHGHAAGDTVLVGVARALRSYLRAEDQLGRLGGEEFLALLPDADGEAVATATEKLRAEVAALACRHGEIAIDVTISVGWATWGGEPAEELLRRADEALYAAKDGGRDRSMGAAPASLQRRT
jgi:two-component system cell cycle response regulator